MKEFDIRDYIWDIYEIAEFYKISIYKAMDMFIENLNLGYDRYKGSNLDFEKLSEVWNNLLESYHTHERVIFDKVINTSYDKLCDARNAKNKELFTSICKSVRVTYGIIIKN